MMRNRLLTHCSWIFVGMLGLLSLACSGPKVQGSKPPTKIAVTAEAGPTINRDVNGDPLSVVVHVYHLKDKAAFSKLTFENATSGQTDQELLGADLLGRTELVVVPNMKVVTMHDITAGTKYIGVVAFFRKPDPNYWRYLIPMDQLLRLKAKGQEWKGKVPVMSIKVEDCFLTLKNITPELIPGQPANATPDCGGMGLYTPLKPIVSEKPVTATIQTPATPVAVTGMPPAGPSIVIDGKSSDWSAIQPLATAIGQASTNLKVTSDSTYVYVCVQGAALGKHYNLFLNTDNNPNTGKSVAPWASSGADYMIENGALLKWSGSSWTPQGTRAVSAKANASTVEIRVTKANLPGIASTFTVGFKDMDAKWKVKSLLPLGNSFADINTPEGSPTGNVVFFGEGYGTSDGGSYVYPMDKAKIELVDEGHESKKALKIQMYTRDWSGVGIFRSPLNLSRYQSQGALEVWVKGSRGGEEFGLGLVDKTNKLMVRLSSQSYVPHGLKKNTWTLIRVPLKDFPSKAAKLDAVTHKNVVIDFDWTKVAEVVLDNNGPGKKNADILLDDIVIRP